MRANDLERTLLVGARLTTSAVSLALAPVRLALRAVRSSEPRAEPDGWQPPPQPSPVVPLREPEPVPGPEVHVTEPWEGYATMNVAQVLERLGGEQHETVRAMVRLYEERHKNRRGVLRATE